jgi:cyanophycin synthetase
VADDDRLIVQAKHLYRGPNRWSALPVHEVEIDAGALRGWSPQTDPVAMTRFAGWRDRLEATPYEVAVERAASGRTLPRRAGPAFDELTTATGPEPVLLWLDAVLLGSAGIVTRFARWVGDDGGRFRMAVELDDEEVSVACLDLARKLLLSAVDGVAVDLEAELANLAEFADDARLGPSTRAIVRAAERRGIPCRRVTDNSLCQLGEGVWKRRIWTAETDATGAIAEALAQDKQMTRMLLKQVGVPVPRGGVATSVEGACAAAAELGYPVVVKPRDGNHGRGISFGVRDDDDMHEAFEIAIRENHRRSGGVIVEQFAHGVAHRLLVVGDRCVAAARGQNDTVIGDGVRTIRELVEDANRDPLRGPNFTDILSLMKLDDLAVGLLKRQSLDPQSVPATGRRVTIKVNGDLTTDETDEIHPDVARHAVLAARAVGLDIAGIDVVAEDIGRPLWDQRGMVIEVNAGPGMFMHIAPKQGKPRPVGEAIVDLMFKGEDDGRVPVIAVGAGPVAGDVVATLAGFLRGGGIVAGVASGSRIDVPGQAAYDFPGSDRDRAVAGLAHPHVEAAILLSQPADAAREGLATLHCEVAVLAPGDGAADPASGPIDPATATLLHAIEPDGLAILDAAAPTADAILAAVGPRVVLVVDGPVVGAVAARVGVHRVGGGRVVLRSGTAARLCAGRAEHDLSAADLVDVMPALPAGIGGALALAAIWGAGLLPGDRLMPPRPVAARLRFAAGGSDA